MVKIIALYRTNNYFRIARSLLMLNIERIIKLENLECERLSTHLHLLKFQMKD